MKEGIHPKYEQTTIRCACGAVIETGSTKKDIKVEICSKCHPFYTGKQKLVDTGGRVDRFNKKYGLYSTVRGKKSFGVSSWASQTVTRATVPQHWIQMAPLA